MLWFSFKNMSAGEGKSCESISQEERKALGADFSMSLIKALLKSTYYTIDHPAAMKSFEDMYGGLLKILEGFGEISYVISRSQNEEGILLDGVLEDATRLSKIMSTGTSELFEPKFVEYLNRRSLFSLTIKSGVTREELLAFINLMNQPIDHDNIETERERVNGELSRLEIRTIAIIWRAEMVGEERKLSWRTNMALTRLSKDLSAIPMLKEKNIEELALIKRHIISDIMRPIRHPQYIKEILINMDLVEESAAYGLGIDLVQETIETLKVNQIVLVAREIYKEQKISDPLRPSVLSTTIRQKTLTLAVKSFWLFVGKIAQEDFEQGNLFLEELYGQGEIELEDLSPTLKFQVETRRKADEFQVKEDKFLGLLEQITDEGDYGKLLDFFLRIAPELFKRGRFDSIARVLDILSRQSTMANAQPLYRRAAKALRELARGKLMEQVRERLESVGSDEERAGLAHVMSTLGEDGARALMDVLVTSQDPAVQRIVFSFLVKLGRGAAPLLIRELRSSVTPLGARRSLMRVAGQVADASFADDLQRFLNHPDVQLRAQALAAYAHAAGDRAREELIAALEDNEEEVQAAAVSCLGAMRETSVETLEFYCQALGAGKARGKQASASLQIAVIVALDRMGDIPLPCGMSSVGLLIHLVNPRKGGLLKAFHLKGSRPATEVLIAAIGAIGKMGGEEAARLLEPLRDDHDPEVARHALDAILRIQRRVKPGKPQPF